MNKLSNEYNNYVPSEHNYIIPASFSLYLNTKAITQQLRVSVRIAKKTPFNYLPYWHNISQCIKTGMGYCSNINTQPLLAEIILEDQNTELLNFSR